MSSGLIKEAKKLIKTVRPISGERLDLLSPVADAIIDGTLGDQFTWRLTGYGDTSFRGISTQGTSIDVDIQPSRVLAVRNRNGSHFDQMWINTSPQHELTRHLGGVQTEESLRSNLRDLRRTLEKILTSK